MQERKWFLVAVFSWVPEIGRLQCKARNVGAKFPFSFESVLIKNALHDAPPYFVIFAVNEERTATTKFESGRLGIGIVKRDFSRLDDFHNKISFVLPIGADAA